MRQGKVINEESSLMGVPKQGLSALLQCKCPLGVALLALCASFVCALLSLSVPFSLGQKEGRGLSLRCKVFKN